MNRIYPLISIGIPLYNGADYILEALKHIEQQTYPNLEVVIVDDASTDKSYDLCKQWLKETAIPARLIPHEHNRGLPATCNSILDQIKGDFLQLVDQDDLLLPQKLEADMDFFQSLGAGVAFVYSRVFLVDKSGKTIDQDYFERIGYRGDFRSAEFTSLVKKNFIPGPSVLMRADCMKAAGGYDDSLLFQDWDMWLKLCAKYKGSFHDVCNVKYRIHGASMMGSHNLQLAIERNSANIVMLKKYLGIDKVYDRAIKNKLRELTIYSFYKGDRKARSKLWAYLERWPDAKLILFYLMASMGLKHPSTKY